MRSKILFLAIALMFTAQAKAVTITLGANNYNVTAYTPGADALTIQSLLASQPWWGDNSLAFNAASQVGLQLGSPNQGLGPIFATSTSTGALQWANQGVFNVAFNATYSGYTFAIVDQPQTPSVPDSGATIALLGASLLGLTALRRRFIA